MVRLSSRARLTARYDKTQRRIQPRKRGIQSRKLVAFAACVLGAGALSESGLAAEIRVTTTTQEITGTGGCSLQEAIYSANFDRNVAIDSTNPDHFIATACESGSGDDVIVLPERAEFFMARVLDDAHNPVGPTATPIVFSNITIEAHGAHLQRSFGAGNFRAFAVAFASVDLNPGGTPEIVSGTGRLTIRNAHIEGFGVKGGDGATGGGGGLGAGGAIYVKGGTLVVEACTFEGNGALGGDGSNYFSSGPAGGGGGLSGNGGFARGDLLELGDGGGGGGGGSRGDGGDAGILNQPASLFDAGGSGGGTVNPGKDPTQGRDGGFACGGNTGSFGEVGSDAPCEGGGGGGGGQPEEFPVTVIQGGTGGKGGYGGGGGGAGYNNMTLADIGTTGGNGGFGGGGGGGSLDKSGGDAGFGGGGGRGASNFGDAPGEGGTFGGDASVDAGGGGAALGGAIFNHGGGVTILNSTFTGNFVDRGRGGSGGLDGTPGAPGTDAGGAIFSVAGALTVIHSTLSGNESTGEGAGIAVYKPTTGEATSFNLRNTIIADSLPPTRECFVRNGPLVFGSGNLIDSASGFPFDARTPCPGIEQTGNPVLGALRINAPGLTPTMEIPADSSAIDTGDPNASLDSDQRGVTRAFGAGPDIGAYERGNNPPVAVCTDVTVTAGESCTANASVDNGSFDPDAGDSITLAQSPAGPYPLGANSVTLTATDSFGATNSCSATVTVVDDTPPVVSSSVAKSLLAPMKNHDLVNVGLAASATDACGAPTSFSVEVAGDEDDEATAGGVVFSPDARNIAVNTLRLRAERADSGDGRVYLIAVSAADGSGNTGFNCNTVVVPRNTSAASKAAVNSQAAAALSYCQANNGALPPGYVIVGDGPVIGNKQ